MEKRGQAAMEFLMTYGWAILAAVIAIGVLAYFGVFSPGRFMTETCVLSPPLACEDDTLASDTNGVVFLIRNGAGEQINITGINVSNCGVGSGSLLGCAVSGSCMIDAGETNTFGTINVTCDDIASGQQFRGNIDVYYTLGSGTRVLSSTGNIVRKQAVA